MHHAAAGIPEYLIVAIPDRQVEVHTEPVADDDTQRVVLTDGIFASGSVPGLLISLDQLWSKTFAR